MVYFLTKAVGVMATMFDPITIAAYLIAGLAAREWGAAFLFGAVAGIGLASLSAWTAGHSANPEDLFK